MTDKKENMAESAANGVTNGDNAGSEPVQKTAAQLKKEAKKQAKMKKFAEKQNNMAANKDSGSNEVIFAVFDVNHDLPALCFLLTGIKWPMMQYYNRSHVHTLT